MMKTKWDKIVSGKELSTSKRLRARTFRVAKERTSALRELEEEGWVKFKEYKNPKFIGVKKEKFFDEQFEDKVWLLFANMGFTDMNVDRDFAMSYDYTNPDFTQQIDIFAADEETVLIVECKAAEKIRNGTFKKLIEAFHGQMDGLRKEAKKRYPGRKIKFIWATQNYIMNNADLEKLRDWGIAYFSDAIIDYYIELTKHLGTGAKYQLLGNLFANTEIKNMEDCVPAIQGKMGNHVYYSFSIEPERLLKIGYVLHRNEANNNMMPTYQRLIKRKRVQEIRKFVNEGGYFPNSIIISIDTRGRGIQFDQSNMKVETSISKLGILHLPKRYRSAYIIDGQHRLYGYSDSKYASSNSIPVVAFIDLERQEQIKLFMDINENQKAVPKTLRVTLNSDLLWESEDFNERVQALRSKIAQMMGEKETSPLYTRVLIGENEQSQIRCITVEAIQLALKKCNFFSTYRKGNIIVTNGTFDLGKLEETCGIFYPFIEGCFSYVKEYTEHEWEKGKDGILTINRGIQAIIRVINDIVNLLVKNGEVDPKVDKTDILVKEVCYYLDPLIDFINSSSEEEKKGLRNFVGNGAYNRFWRAFQKKITEVRDDFQPEGLDEYWKNEAKLYNSESREFLIEIEKAVKNIIEEKLEEKIGANWMVKGLPKSIYTKAKKISDGKNYDLIMNDSTEETTTAWDCVSLSDCKEVIVSGSNWSELFESCMVRPEETKISGGKEAKTKWLVILENIKNKLQKATYSVSTEDYEFISSIYRWIKSNDNM